MAPAIDHNIPITIRNSFRPDIQGTQITAPTARPTPLPGAPVVKGFSTIDAMSLINVEGAGMIGVPGVAHRLFGALRDVGVSVVMISQASSEHSICFAVHEAQTETAIETVKNAFFREITEGQIQTIDAVGPCSILAAVGDAMVETPGVAAQFFDALANAGVNVRAIAQGSSERNISAVIDQVDSTRALRAVHAGFFLSQQTLSVGLVGPGLIGSALLAQIHAQAEFLPGALPHRPAGTRHYQLQAHAPRRASHPPRSMANPLCQRERTCRSRTFCHAHQGRTPAPLRHDRLHCQRARRHMGPPPGWASASTS